jgi:hypothetical protein
MFGRGNISDAPPGVTAVFEAVKLHVERVHEACASLQQSASIGNETSKFLVEEHWRAQQLSHFRSKEETSRLSHWHSIKAKVKSVLSLRFHLHMRECVYCMTRIPDFF